MKGPGGVDLSTATGQPVMAAPCSYAAFVGGDETEVSTGDDNGQFHGCFYRNSAVRLTDLTDGTSHTALAADRACGITQGTWAGAVPGARMRLGPANPANAINPNMDYDPDLFGLVHANVINATNSSLTTAGRTTRRASTPAGSTSCSATATSASSATRRRQGITPAGRPAGLLGDGHAGRRGRPVDLER